MKKITRADIRGPRLYEAIRDDMRRSVIALKARRRVSVGPVVSLVFENRATVLFQIEEMLRAEHIEEPARVQAEIDVYNELLPDEGELAATLLVEITENAQIRPTLNRLVGLDEHVVLEAGGERVRGRFEEGRQEEDRISAVQFVRFAIPAAARRALETPGAPAAIHIDHPAYQHSTTLGEATREELARDLA